MIQIQNLTKKFGNFTAVDDLNLQVESGELFGFLGPNGAGKTTTVKIISGIMSPTSGGVYVDGVSVARDPVLAKSRIAYIPDEPFVYPHLTGWEFLRLMGDLYSVDVDAQLKEIPALIETFELKEVADELLQSYSHGMKQKLLIASVLLRKPRVILFDEPTVGLDPKSIKKFKDLIAEQTRKGVSVFMCTHILDMAEKLCNRVGIIYRGKLAACGTTEEIKKHAGLDGNLEDIFLKITADE
ncbi:MAG: hypothetical protein COT17_01990 [Elusimicrobia bacterium CG08_land_8_20_14_0_20_51_18]|nr:MAG: hypothetical protein COT17_01990 [Elusimicrobia bacterium CG08_land_8_20_14_0_20_51_18]